MGDMEANTHQTLSTTPTGNTALPTAMIRRTILMLLTHQQYGAGTPMSTTGIKGSVVPNQVN